MQYKLLVLVSLAMFTSGIACAESERPHESDAYSCSAPVRPADDSDDVLWEQFLADVDAFRACVNAQVQWHQRAADGHLSEAKKLVGSWNEFVKTSLNAPEDYPFPAQK